MDLAKRTLNNSLFTLAAFLWPIALSFFATPFIVHHLGTEKYGIMAFSASFVGFLAFLDFGISPALVRFATEYIEKRDYKSLNRLFSSAVFLYLLLGVLGCLAIVVAAMLFAPSLLKTTSTPASTVQLVLYLTGFGLLINLVLSAFSALPGVMQRFDITSKINVVVSTLSTGLTVGLLALGFGLPVIVGVGLITSLLGLIIYAAVNHHLIPQLKLRLQIDPATTKRILAFGGYATITTFATTILFQLDKIILGSRLGAEAVAYYTLPGSLAVKIYSLFLTVTTVLFPLSSQLIVQRDYAKLQSVYFRSTRIVLTLIAIGVTPLYIFAHTFLLHWVGPTFAAQSTFVFQLLLATYSMLSLTAIPSYLAYAASKPKYNALFTVIYGTLNVTLLLVLVRFGINGAAIAYVFSVLPAIAYLFFIEHKILRLRAFGFYINLAPRLLAMALLSIFISLMLRPMISHTSEFLLAYVITVALTSGVYVAAGFMPTEDKDLILGMLRHPA